MNRGSPRTPKSTISVTLRFNEAPIHESGKCSRSSADSHAARRFNEAPIHESGKFEPRNQGLGCQLGFNEAPIHESGKSSGYHPAMTPTPSFNEAPIHESGKCHFEPLETPLMIASMRPRFMNRGSFRIILPQFAPAKLQ